MDTTNNKPFLRPNPLDDYLFYKVMGEKGDEVQLLGFLNAVLGKQGKKPIESLKILGNSSYVKDVMEGKTCILDILAVLCDGTRVNVEVQLSNEYNMDRRSLFYWSKVYTGSLEEGKDYSELPNVIAINIVDFNIKPVGKLHSSFKLRENDDPSIVLTDALEIHFLNMVQWRKQKGKDPKNDPLHRWLTWFDKQSPSELVEEIIDMDGPIAEAYRKLEEACRDQDAYRSYWAQRKYDHDKISAINGARREGLQKGNEQGRLEVARKMKEMGLPIAQIAEGTGLSAEAVEQL